MSDPGDVPDMDAPPGPAAVGKWFAWVYLLGVVVAALLFRRGVRTAWAMGTIVAAPAVFAVGVSFWNGSRSPAWLFLLVLPLLAAITIGGPGALVAYAVSGLFD